MMVAATFIARILHQHRWIAYLGIAVIFYVAGVMLWEGSNDVIAMFQQN